MMTPQAMSVVGQQDPTMIDQQDPRMRMALIQALQGTGGGVAKTAAGGMAQAGSSIANALIAKHLMKNGGMGGPKIPDPRVLNANQPAPTAMPNMLMGAGQ